MRRVVRRTARRAGRRAVRRMTRRWVIGGFVLLAAGGAAAAYKLTTKDVDRIEAHTGEKAENLSEDQLVASMKELGIKSIALDENDRAAISKGG